MDIFKNWQQAVRFSFIAEETRSVVGSSRNSLVWTALVEVGSPLTGSMLGAPTLNSVARFADKVIDAIDGKLIAAERAALVAPYSRNWDDKRSATEWLKPHLRHQLSSLVDNPQLADRLIARHYIAQRDRGAGWTIEAIAAEFRVSLSRVNTAARMLELLAGQLETEALESLARILPLPTLEAEHAE